jgi:hypothetical protein
MTRREIETDVESGLLALGRSVRYWRAPWGLITPATEKVANKNRLRLVGWTADTKDWRGGTPEEMLAGRCDELLAVYVSERAVVAASERLSGRKHVVVKRRTLSEEMPGGPFDLIVASEILYYLTEDEMLATLRSFERELAQGGVLLAVHWRRKIRTYPLQGDEVHELLWNIRGCGTSIPSTSLITACISSRCEP